MTHELELQTITPEDLENVNAGFLRYAAPAARIGMTGLKYGAKGLGYGFKGVMGVTSTVLTVAGVGYAYSILKPMAVAGYDYAKEKITGVKKPEDPGPEIVE